MQGIRLTDGFYRALDRGQNGDVASATGAGRNGPRGLATRDRARREAGSAEDSSLRFRVQRIEGGESGGLGRRGDGGELSSLSSRGGARDAPAACAAPA